MGIQLDENAYQKLIDENIEALNKYMPEHSLEKKHTIEVLKWSVQQIYHRPLEKKFTRDEALNLAEHLMSNLLSIKRLESEYSEITSFDLRRIKRELAKFRTAGVVVESKKGPINEPIIFDSIKKGMEYFKFPKKACTLDQIPENRVACVGQPSCDKCPHYK
jgi:hypothetical protein